jgi:hypothetical protein
MTRRLIIAVSNWRYAFWLHWHGGLPLRESIHAGNMFAREALTRARRNQYRSNRQ